MTFWKIWKKTRCIDRMLIFIKVFVLVQHLTASNIQTSKLIVLQTDFTYFSTIDSSKVGGSSNDDDVPEVSLEEMLDDLNIDDVEM